jgi:hypothetical protein
MRETRGTYDEYGDQRDCAQPSPREGLRGALGVAASRASGG